MPADQQVPDLGQGGGAGAGWDGFDRSGFGGGGFDRSGFGRGGAGGWAEARQ
jgi:hypothetical protein